MATQPNSMLENYRSETDGKKFFSRSPWRSGSFLLGTVLCLGSLLFDTIIIFMFWQKLSQRTASTLFFIGSMVFGIWLRHFRGLDELGEIYVSSYIGDRKPEAHVDIMLGRTASLSLQTLVVLGGTCMVVLTYFFMQLSHGLLR